MKIILTQNEIEETLRDSVLQQISIRDDQDITIDFEDDKDGNLTAVIGVEKSRSSEKSETAPQPAAKPRGRPRKEKAAAPEPMEEGVTTAPEVPWEEEPTKAAEAQERLQEHLEEVKAIKEEAKTALKIFPEATSSAPPAAPKPAVNSLFANLTKPVHDAPRD